MQPGADPTDVRLAELLAALSLAIDFAMGQPQEHVLRTTVVAIALARTLNLGEREVGDTY